MEIKTMEKGQKVSVDFLKSELEVTNVTDNFIDLQTSRGKKYSITQNVNGKYYIFDMKDFKQEFIF